MAQEGEAFSVSVFDSSGSWLQRKCRGSRHPGRVWPQVNAYVGLNFTTRLFVLSWNEQIGDPTKPVFDRITSASRSTYDLGFVLGSPESERVHPSACECVRR